MWTSDLKTVNWQSNRKKTQKRFPAYQKYIVANECQTLNPWTGDQTNNNQIWSPVYKIWTSATEYYKINFWIRSPVYQKWISANECTTLNPWSGDQNDNNQSDNLYIRYGPQTSYPLIGNLSANNSNKFPEIYCSE